MDKGGKLLRTKKFASGEPALLGKSSKLKDTIYVVVSRI